MKFITIIPFQFWPIAAMLLFVWACFGLNGFLLAVVIATAIMVCV